MRWYVLAKHNCHSPCGVGTSWKAINIAPYKAPLVSVSRACAIRKARTISGELKQNRLFGAWQSSRNNPWSWARNTALGVQNKQGGSRERQPRGTQQTGSAIMAQFCFFQACVSAANKTRDTVFGH